MTRAVERYGDRIFGHAGDTEDERLRVLAEELDPVSYQRLRSLTLRSDARCLELGAGTGTVARWLAGRCPDGTVTATDLDLDLVRSRFEPQHNLSWLRHDVTRDDFAPGSFDLIHARYLFCHLPDRDAALAKVVTWLAPGGWLLLEEPARFPIDSAADEVYRRTGTAVFDVLAERIGTDCHWPRGLHTVCTRLGLTDVDLDVAQSVVGADLPMARFWRLTVEQLAPALLAVDGVTEPMLTATMAKMRDPNYRELGMATVAAWGRLR